MCGGECLRNFYKFFEKNCWQLADPVVSYTSCLTQTVGSKKRLEKSWKKGLTSEGEPDIVYRLSQAESSDESRERKKFEKTWKKFLTNARECAKIVTVPPMRRAPCKLNNVTNEKHQTETFLVECRRKGCRPGFSQLPGAVTRFWSWDELQ